MDRQLTHLEPLKLPRPARGASSRFRLGRLELVFEPVRGGYTLLCLDGSGARTWSLGLSPVGDLWIECRQPRWPLRIGLRETLALVPGARVRGYVQVPLVPTLSWRREGHRDCTVCELLPQALAAEWEESSNQVVQRVESPFLQRVPLPDEHLRAIVPIAICNRSDAVQSPERIPLALREGDLRTCRQHRIAPPQRLLIDSSGRIQQVSRETARESLS